MGCLRQAGVQGPRRRPIYAIVRAGGKQYRIERDQLLDVDRLQAEVGSTVELNDVLLVADGADVQVGKPIVDGARVLAEVLEHGRGEKLLVFKYKSKVRYRRKHGHRQDYTRVAIRQILTAGGEPVPDEETPKRTPRTRRVPKAKGRAAQAAEAPAKEREIEAVVPEVPAAEVQPKRRAPRASAKATGKQSPAKPSARPRRKKAADDAAPPGDMNENGSVIPNGS